MALLVAPVKSEDVPAGHCSHAEEPASLEKAPERHVKHAALDEEPEEGLYNPAAHWTQSVRAPAPVPAP